MTIVGRTITATLTSILVVVGLAVYFEAPGLLLLISAILGLPVMWLSGRWLESSEEKANAQMAQWAAEHGWQLMELKREFSTGPFGGIYGRADLYYQFVILDAQARKRRGWAYFDFSLVGGGRWQIKWNENDDKPLP